MHTGFGRYEAVTYTSHSRIATCGDESGAETVVDNGFGGHLGCFCVALAQPYGVDQAD